MPATADGQQIILRSMGPKEPAGVLALLGRGPTLPATIFGRAGRHRRGGPASLYLHIPFCKTLRWYCGCHSTKRHGACCSEPGYAAIGLNHYAPPNDPMAQAAAEGTLRRNFQGYATDGAPALIGLGASSPSQGYASNPVREEDARCVRAPCRPRKCQPTAGLRQARASVSLLWIGRRKSWMTRYASPRSTLPAPSHGPLR
ncbi:hypothetical protein [Muricoccus aerilatus]|uniref:hypothetical protein n=1 Tax=Muricoccus aerilatus TaxID=452982 RepID=UPI0009FD3F5C